jgi:hypothetical protein
VPVRTVVACFQKTGTFILATMAWAGYQTEVDIKEKPCAANPQP